MSLKHSLPPLLAQFIPQQIKNLNLLEQKATCSNCAMAPNKTRGKVHYNPHLKCCTFYPFQPNFLVGGVIEAGGVGAEVVTKIIQEQRYALPIGLVAPPAYQSLFNQRGPLDFGNREDLLCPYFNSITEDCNIWQNRGSVCVSFICKSSYGKPGLEFWAGLGDYLHFVEMAVMEELLVQLDFSPRQVSDQLRFINLHEPTATESKARRLNSKQWVEFWNYYEDPVKFYIKCFHMAQKLTRKEIKLTMGPQGLAFEKRLEALASQLRSHKNYENA